MISTSIIQRFRGKAIFNLIVVLILISALPYPISSEEDYEERQADKVYTFDIPLSDMDMTKDGKYFLLSSYLNLSWYQMGEDEPDWVSSGPGGAVQISGDGNFFLSVGRDTVTLYDSHNSIEGVNYPIAHYVTLGRITSMDISHDGSIFCVADDLGNIYLFELTQFLVDITLPKWIYNTTYEILSIALSGNGEYLVAGTDNTGKRVYFFSIDSSTPLWVHHARKGLGGGYYSIDITFDGSSIIIENVGEATLLHKTSNQTVWLYQTTGSLEVVRITPDDKYCVVGTSRWGLHYLDEDGHLIRKYDYDHFLHEILINSDGKYLLFHNTDWIADNRNWTLFVYFITPNGNRRFTLNGTQAHAGSIAMSNDGKFNILCYRNNVYLFINNDDGQEESDDRYIPEWSLSPLFMIGVVGIITIVILRRKLLSRGKVE